MTIASRISSHEGQSKACNSPQPRASAAVAAAADVIGIMSRTNTVFRATRPRLLAQRGPLRTANRRRGVSTSQNVMSRKIHRKDPSRTVISMWPDMDFGSLRAAHCPEQKQIAMRLFYAADSRFTKCISDRNSRGLDCGCQPSDNRTIYFLFIGSSLWKGGSSIFRLCLTPNSWV